MSLYCITHLFCRMSEWMKATFYFYFLKLDLPYFCRIDLPPPPSVSSFKISATLLSKTKSNPTPPPPHFFIWTGHFSHPRTCLSFSLWRIFRLKSKSFQVIFLCVSSIRTYGRFLQYIQLVIFLLHCTENLKQIFPEMKLRGLIRNFYINVSGSDLYIPMIVLICNLIHS
jgi:hypothetical protein